MNGSKRQPELMVTVTPFAPGGRRFRLPKAHGDAIARKWRESGHWPILMTRNDAIDALEDVTDLCGRDPTVEHLRAAIASDEETGMVLLQD